jgi:hypothetical protein
MNTQRVHPNNLIRRAANAVRRAARGRVKAGARERIMGSPRIAVEILADACRLFARAADIESNLARAK